MKGNILNLIKIINKFLCVVFVFGMFFCTPISINAEGGIMITLQKLTESNEYLIKSLEKIKAAKNDPRKIHKLTIELSAGGGNSLSTLRQRSAVLEGVIRNIQHLVHDTADQRYYTTLFGLFIRDHSAHINSLEKKWKEAKEDYEYLMANSEGISFYYSVGNDWVRRFAIYCSIMEMLKNGRNKNFIRQTPEYRSMDRRFYEDADSKYFPEIGEIINAQPFEVVRISRKEDCAICQDEVKNSVTEPLKSTFCDCKYYYHKDCIEEAIRTTFRDRVTCPICKARPN